MIPFRQQVEVLLSFNSNAKEGLFEFTKVHALSSGLRKSVFLVNKQLLALSLPAQRSKYELSIIRRDDGRINVELRGEISESFELK